MRSKADLRRMETLQVRIECRKEGLLEERAKERNDADWPALGCRVGGRLGYQRRNGVVPPTRRRLVRQAKVEEGAQMMRETALHQRAQDAAVHPVSVSGSIWTSGDQFTHLFSCDVERGGGYPG